MIGKYKNGYGQLIDKSNLQDEIISLIESHQEGEYWDFKQEHHRNTADLLHDILCMANSPIYNRDGYIIYGIEDKTYNIMGIENDSQRRNQEYIISQLKSKKFAGGIRPNIYLATLGIENHEIDVLIIKSTLETPYYLTSDYKDQNRIVRANSIYTRVGDTNTDIDKSADKHLIEALWKKHFGLSMTPFERLKYLLAFKEDWVKNEEQQYNKTSPEFTLVIEDDDDFGKAEFYAYAMTNENMHYGIIKANYFGTTLYSCQTVSLDSGRYLTVVPKWGYIHYDKYRQNYDGFKYFIKNDISYILHEYLLDDNSDEAQYACSNFREVVLIFNSEKEKDLYIKYIESSLELLEDEISLDEFQYSHIEPNNQRAHDKIVRQLKLGKALKSIYLKWVAGT